MAAAGTQRGLSPRTSGALWLVSTSPHSGASIRVTRPGPLFPEPGDPDDAVDKLAPGGGHGKDVGSEVGVARAGATGVAQRLVLPGGQVERLNGDLALNGSPVVDLHPHLGAVLVTDLGEPLVGLDGEVEHSRARDLAQDRPMLVDEPNELRARVWDVEGFGEQAEPLVRSAEDHRADGRLAPGWVEPPQVGWRARHRGRAVLPAVRWWARASFMFRFAPQVQRMLMAEPKFPPGSTIVSWPSGPFAQGPVVDVLDVGEVVQVPVSASEHEAGRYRRRLAGFRRARCRVAAVVVEAGFFGPVLAHVLELERAAARGAKSGETPAVGAAHPPRERAHRDTDTVGLLLVGTADALF